MYPMPTSNYTTVQRGRTTAMVHADVAAPVADALLEGAGCAPYREAGRGAIMRFPLPTGGHGILRAYRRGGAVQLVLKDQFFLVNRPRHEFMLHCAVEEAGLPVPHLLGVCWRRWGLWYAGSIATFEIAGLELPAWLARHPGSAEDTLAACGAVIRQMHDMGVFHADLQVRNIFISEGKPYLLDFDNAWRKRQLSAHARGRNLLRLHRSLARNGMTEDQFGLLTEAYGRDLLPAHLR